MTVKEITPAGDRSEQILSGGSPIEQGFPAGVEITVFASAACQARAMATARAKLAPGAELPYHRHSCGKAITIVQGQAEIMVQGRVYTLNRLDCAFVPASVEHSVRNAIDTPLLVHTAFSSAAPDRTFVESAFEPNVRGAAQPEKENPESITRFGSSPAYELASGADFYDLFKGSLGATGICGGYGVFQPGSRLPCHFHEYDESITIVSGEAVCEVDGERYRVSNWDTAMVPKGRAHRFLNLTNEPMAMVWVYAGDEPRRTLLSTGRCSQGASKIVTVE